jgi:hypothetical protein
MGTNGSKGANATRSWTPWGWWWPGGRDFGTKTEILSGLDAQDQVVQNPADDLHDGMPVSVERAMQGPQSQNGR